MTPSAKKQLFCHVIYHNCGPAMAEIQQQFTNIVIQPPNECLANEIKNQQCGIFNPKLLVSFH